MNRADPPDRDRIDEVRKVVCDTLASIAPDFAGRPIEPDRPLRQQVDLDSMDWINLLEGLQQRLQVDIPESDATRLTTLDAIAGYLASRQSGEPAPARADPWSALPRSFELADGTRVTLRPMRADDAPLQAQFVRHLSAESRYMRFMATLRELSPGMVKSLTDVDSVHHVALAATVRRGAEEVLLGAARYVVDATGAGCEFAVAVDDDWQGSGLAGRLMHALIAVARARGLERMHGTVLANNGRMLKFMRQLGFSVHRDPEDARNVRVGLALRGEPYLHASQGHTMPSNATK